LLRAGLPPRVKLLRNGPTMSSGKGNTTVEFWSAELQQRLQIAQLQ
jgi:hypothetical protein